MLWVCWFLFLTQVSDCQFLLYPTHMNKSIEEHINFTSMPFAEQKCSATVRETYSRNVSMEEPTADSIISIQCAVSTVQTVSPICSYTSSFRIEVGKIYLEVQLTGLQGQFNKSSSCFSINV